MLIEISHKLLLMYDFFKFTDLFKFVSITLSVFLLHFVFSLDHPLCLLKNVMPSKLFSSFYLTILFFVLPFGTTFGSYYLKMVEIRSTSTLAC